MLRLGMLAISLLILVLVALPSTTSSQNQRARGQQNKFIKRANAIPNRYIVVLNDDVADNDSSREARLERVTEIANEHALAHLGRPDYIYETALKGYAIELPNEAAAVAISRRPEVQWVEEDQGLEKLQVPASPQPVLRGTLTRSTVTSRRLTSISRDGRPVVTFSTEREPAWMLMLLTVASIPGTWNLDLHHSQLARLKPLTASEMLIAGRGKHPDSSRGRVSFPGCLIPSTMTVMDTALSSRALSAGSTLA